MCVSAFSLFPHIHVLKDVNIFNLLCMLYLHIYVFFLNTITRILQRKSILQKISLPLYLSILYIFIYIYDQKRH